jgi:hypothetical protein
MGLQLLVQADGVASILQALGAVGEHSEFFRVEGALWGISVPTKVLDAIGEEKIRQRLALKLNVYDLYAGHWSYV